MRKRRIKKKSTGNDGKAYLKIVDNVKGPLHYAVTSVSHLRKKEINPSNINIEHEKSDTQFKIMNYFKIKATSSSSASMFNWEDENKDERNYLGWTPSESVFTTIMPQPTLKTTMKTIAPKKLKLLKALLKRFRTKTTTDFSEILYKIVDHFVMKTSTPRPYTKGINKTKNHFLALKEFDDIFTPSTEKTYVTDSDILPDEPLSAPTESFSLESETSIARSIKKNETDYDIPIPCNICSGDNKTVIVGTSLNSLAEMNVTKFITKLKNSNSEILPATPITLTVNEDDDDILISNNTMILPLPIFGKYVRKVISKSKLLNSSQITEECGNISHSDMSDIKTADGFNKKDNDSFISYFLRGPNLMELYVNSSFFSILTNVTELQKPVEDQTKSTIVPRPVQKKNFGKNVSLINLITNSSDRNVTETLPARDHSGVTKPFFPSTDPNMKSVYTGSDFLLKTDQGSDNALMSRFSGIKVIKNPTNNTEIMRLVNGTDEYLAIPFELLSNEYIYSSPGQSDYLKDNRVKDHLLSGQIKMNLDKYVRDREDCCYPCCNTKHTTHHHHHKAHPTRFGMHVDNKHCISVSKSPKCLSKSVTECNPSNQDGSDIYEEDMPETCLKNLKKWKCTCKKIINAMERIQHKTENWAHNHHIVKTTTSKNWSTATHRDYTINIYDEDEVEEDYLMDTTELELSEKPKNNSEFENTEEPKFITHRPKEGHNYGDCTTTCSCKRNNPTITGPSRQDIIVSIMCGAATCTECTKCKPNEDGDSFRCLEDVQMETTCIPVTVRTVPEADAPTICTNPPSTTCMTSPTITCTTVPSFCPHCLKTKKRRCTCACFCASKCRYSEKKHAAFLAKDVIYGPTKKDHLNKYPYLKLKDVEKTSTSKKKSTPNFPKVFHASHIGTNAIDIKPQETYYTVSDIELTDYISKTTAHYAFNETENKDESDPDYWIDDSTTDIDTSISSFQSIESSTEFECDLPLNSEEVHETKHTTIIPQTCGIRCSCSREKVISCNNSRDHNICNDNILYGTQDNYNKIKSKYVGKYMTYGLDSSDITYELNRETPLIENINPSYREVTRINDHMENSDTLGDKIESMTQDSDELDLYPKEGKPMLDGDSPVEEMTTQDYEELFILSKQTVPHPLLSPREKNTLTTKNKRILNHKDIRPFLSPHSLPKLPVKSKNNRTKVSTNTTKPVIVINTRKKNHSPFVKSSSSINFLHKAEAQSHFVNQKDETSVKSNGKRPTNMSMIIYTKKMSHSPVESEPIFLPKEIVKSNEIASVKIFFGTNNKEKVKQKTKKGITRTNKFFSFETKI